MTTNDRSITWDDILRRIKVGEDISFIDYIIKLGSKINAILSGATVNSEFKFINCSFECQISILDVKFNKNVTFRGCQFHEAMRFMGVTFENRADFARASFEQTADFGKSADGAIVTFKNETDFTNAEFARVADFSGCKFNGQLFGTRFIESKFNRGFRLLEVECGEKAEIFFDRAMLRQEPEIEGIKFAEDIEEARTFYSLAQACLNSGLSLSAGRFFDNSGQAFKRAYDNEKQERRKQIYDNVIAAFRSSEGAYDSIKEPRRAGQVYKKAMNFRLYYPRPEQKIWRDNLERIWLFIRKYTSDYGESLIRFIVWILGIIAFFALVYAPCEPREYESLLQKRSILTMVFLMLALSFFVLDKFLKGLIVCLLVVFVGLSISVLPLYIEFDECKVLNSDDVSFNVMARSFYFSFITFATLDFDNVLPLNRITAFVVCVEVVCGYLMFGILITILARKILR